MLAAPAGAAEDAVDRRVERLEKDLAGVRRDVAELRALIEHLLARGTAAERAAVEERVAAVEKQTAELDRRQQKLSDAVGEAETNLGILSETEARRSQVTVYGTFNVVDPQGERSVFDGEAFELVLSGQPHERLSFFSEIEFERAASVGGERGGEVLLEQAYATYAWKPWLNLRAGVLLVPFGNFNVDHYAPNRDVIAKPLTSFVVAPSDWTDNGFGFHGSTLLGGAWSFNYETYVVAGLDADVTAAGTRAARQPFGSDNNQNKAVVGRFAWNRGGWLEIGASGYSGKYDDDDRLDLRGWALDTSLTRGRFKLVGEYNRFDAAQLSGPDAVLRGYYGRVVLDVTPGWMRRGWHGSAFPNAQLALVGQYDRVRLAGPLDGVYATNVERRFTFGINYRPTHQWVLKINYEDSEATALPLQRGTLQALLASIGFQF
ncbi:MAG: hypothetical protein D6696_08425 [Acidobacteria bacterium]|nr:MAG: hypothetical protein D6696_08425 [Acidobacteriota bacterium]